MGLATDIAGFTSAATGLFNAMNNYNANVNDPLSLQALQNAKDAFKASTLSLMSDVPALKNAGDVLGVPIGLQSLDTDFAAMTQATTQVDQVSAFLGVVSDASTVVAGVTAVAALGAKNSGIGKAAVLPLGVAAAGATTLGLAAQGAILALNNDPNAAADVANYIHAIQTALGGGFPADFMSAQGGAQIDPSLGYPLVNFLEAAGQAAQDGDDVQFSSAGSTFSTFVTPESGDLPYTMAMTTAGIGTVSAGGGLNVVLQENDIFFLDIGPIFDGHEGDVGRGFAIGTDMEMQKCCADAENIWHEVRNHWQQEKVSGEGLYEFAKACAENRGWRLSLDQANGHRIADFPHAIHIRGTVEEWKETPASDRWILEIQIRHPLRPFGVFYEDLLH